MPRNESDFTWKDIETGTVVTEPGNASNYETGVWRSQRPTYDLRKCIKCGICEMVCPEGCISQNEEGYFVADLYYCKGCGLCARECWPRVITMVEEEE